jgi:thiol-disulfide isomerase/thioredoxin
MVAAALAAAWILFLTFFGPRAPEDEVLPPPTMAAPARAAVADYAFPFRDLEGRPVDLGTFKGRPIFLNIWATWCAPCVAEMPAIARLAADPKLKQVAFVCVSTDVSAGPVKAFLRGKSWPMTILRAEALPAVFLTDGIPATFLIAPDGRIAAAELGPAQWDHPSVVAFLSRLAGEAAESPAAADAVKR